MKFKKIIKYVLIGFFFLLASYFIFCLISNHAIEKALPPKPQILLSINNPKKLISEYDFILKEYPEFNQIKKYLPFVPNFKIMAAKLASGPVLILDTGYLRGVFEIAFFFKNHLFKKEDGVYIESHPKLEEHNMYILKKGKETLGFLSHQRNLFIISHITAPIRTVVMNLNSDHKVIEFNQKGDIAVYFRTKRLLKNIVKSYPQLAFLKDILAKHEYGEANIYFEEDTIKTHMLLRFKEPKTYQDKMISKMLNMSKGSSTIRDITPLRSSSYISFSIDSFEDLYKYIVYIFKDNVDVMSDLKMGRRAVKYLSKHELQEFFQWMGTEVAAATLTDYETPLLIIKVKDKDKFYKTFEKFIGDKADGIEEINIKEIVLPGIVGFLKSIFAPSIKLPFFALYKDCLIISSAPKDIKTYIKRSTNVNIVDSDNFKRVDDNSDSKAQIFFYMDLSYGYFPFLRITPILRKLIKKYYKMGGSVRFMYPEMIVDFTIAK